MQSMQLIKGDCGQTKLQCYSLYVRCNDFILHCSLHVVTKNIYFSAHHVYCRWMLWPFDAQWRPLWPYG